MKVTLEVREVRGVEARESRGSRESNTNKDFRDLIKQRFYKTTQLTGNIIAFFEFLKDIFSCKERGGERGYFGAIYSKMSFFPIQQIRQKKILRLREEGWGAMVFTDPYF